MMIRLCDVTRSMTCHDEVEVIFMGNLDFESSVFSVQCIPEEYDLLFVHMMTVVCDIAKELPEPYLRIYLSAV